MLAGAIFRRPAGFGRLLGSLLHFAAGTFLFPTAYAVGFEMMARADVGLGAAMGLLHGVLAAALLPIAWHRTGDQGPAGLLGRRLGPLTPIGIVMTHVLYGALLGYIYVVPD